MCPIFVLTMEFLLMSLEHIFASLVCLELPSSGNILTLPLWWVSQTDTTCLSSVIFFNDHLYDICVSIVR